VHTFLGWRESPVGPLIAANELWNQLEQYFRGERREFTLPLAHPGTWSAARAGCRSERGRRN
jgi:hypothetical protein